MVEIKISGPLRVACFDEFKDSSLDDAECRRKVIEELQKEADVHRVLLDGPIVRVYLSEKIHKIARAIAIAKRLALDDLSYSKYDEKKCNECIQKRKEAILKILEDLPKEPLLFKKLVNPEKRATKKDNKCVKCASVARENLFSEIISLFEDFTSGKSYAEIFCERKKPFFVDGIWNPPPEGSKLVDEYELRNKRGLVRIWERKDSPVLFYELDLPEFHIPKEELELLYSAFNVQFDEPPPHAKFSFYDIAHTFTEEWYVALLHSIRSRTHEISSRRIHELSKILASWITYRLLEPFSCDDYLTDIYVHAPPELQPLMVEHEKWGRLETGIYWDTPSLLSLGESIASRLGTSFDEVRPQLDAEIPELGMRVFISRDPAIWPKSVEMSVRKRRVKPWTQPLFIFRGTLSPLASAFLSNALRIGCSAFVIGEMGTAKTSQIETYIPEIGLQNRIVVFQDTQELHIEDFIANGYRISDVRAQNPEQLEKQIRAFLRGGQSYWLITEVRSSEAVRSVLGAAVRQGSQPVVASFHAREKREAFVLVTHIMGLHPEAFKYIDLIISTARFSTRSGNIRRIIEIAEVRKDWKENPLYVEIFGDDRQNDILLSKNLFSGPKNLVFKWNSTDLSKLDLKSSARLLRFKAAEEGGSDLIPKLCKKQGMDLDEFLVKILAEAKLKSFLLVLSQKSGKNEYLELPFVTKAYGVYFSLLRKLENPVMALEEWKKWLQKK
ncbi:MAG: ATPase, T2SS/T4P/T4SS family [Candidatus Hadarchaeales archaeon]